MKIIWEVEPAEIRRVKDFYKSHKSNPFVKRRIERNLGRKKTRITKPAFFKAMIACLVTTQQRSGPNSPVQKFLKTSPFPLSIQKCREQINPEKFAQKVLSKAGMRRFNRIANEICVNLQRLDDGLWKDLSKILNGMIARSTAKKERDAAEFINENLAGFGPKQSCNLLQILGLSKYEIPIDSRITKWLNDFGFPVRLNAKALADRDYYNFVSDGIQQLCKKSNLKPCLLDAAVFSSFDKGGWTKEDISL